MTTHEHDVQAAPPDDGHLGSFTQPSDTLQTRDLDEPKSPALHRDQERHAGGSQSVPYVTWMLIALVGFVAVVVGLVL